MLSAHLIGHIGTLRIEVELLAERGPLVVVGPNGAGKTSLLLMLLGVLRPEFARIVVGDEVLQDTAKKLDVPTEFRRLGYLPQSYALFPHLSVRENLGFALGSAEPRMDRDAQAQRIEAILVELKLQALADRLAVTLSGGEKQRLALARTLCATPRALLLDEPLAALDIGTRREVRRSLETALAKLDLPTILVTHDPVDAKALGHRIAVLEAGRIVQFGTWSDLTSKPATQFVEELIAPG